ncbi:MAG TPA: tetratricopeptide repeat protein [Blastocatellia bacterium]|nr:tetratricopeptide repeat protein [Blastocatellia bacterium]
MLSFSVGCSSKAQLERAQAAWDSGDYATAADLYEEFLKLNPQGDKNGFARLQAATICRRDLKQHDRAIQHYLHFIEDFPKSSDLYQAKLSLAECYFATQKYREAIGEYESALPLATDTKEKRRVRLKIADQYYELKDLGQALAEYQKVVKDAAYDELCEKAYLQLGGIHLLRDEFDEAVPVYQTVVQYTQDPPLRRTARIRLADCYERIFEYDQAIQLLKETEPDPASPNYIPQRIAAIQEQQRQRNLSPQSTLNWKKK